MERPDWIAAQNRGLRDGGLNAGFVRVEVDKGVKLWLARLDALAKDPRARELAEYHLWHAARADLLRRLGKASDAAAAYRNALAQVGTGPERRFLERRLKEVE